MQKNKGILRVYGEIGTGRFLGAEMIGPGAEHIAHLLSWAVEANRTVQEMLDSPFYHPVIEEGVRTALRDLNRQHASRSGFVLSEGSGVLVIERLSHARDRGATPLAVLSGYGTSGDAHHITAGPEDGSGAVLAIERALSRAELDLDQIGYINGHATSTPVGDTGEVAALRRVFGDALPDIPISSTKSSIGHLLGAAGSVEAIFSILATMTGRIPATLNFQSADQGNEDLDFVPDLGRETDVKHVVCNAFGFGGVNASLVVSKFPPIS